MSKGTLKDKKITLDKEKQAYAFYISKGWTPEQAIGIVGNLKRESNFKTTIVGTADDKGSVGLAQWHGDRLKTLKNKYGNNWTDFNSQLEFVDWELKNTHKSAGDKLKNTKGVWQAGQVVSDFYEIPKVKFVGDETRQKHVSDLAMKFKGVKITPEDMPYADASYANSVAPYMNQPTPTINNLQIPQQNTNFASVPDSAEKENKTEEDKDVAEVEQKTKEFNFLDELNTTASFFKPRETQQIEAPQTDYMQQYEQISQFVENPQVAQQGKKFKLQDERNLVQKDNTPNTKRNLSLMLAEYNNAKKDEQELRTTGQIKNPNSIQYRRNVKTQPDIKQDNISTEQRNAPLNLLQRPLIYLANPEKVLGDLGVPGMETSELDRQAINANTFNPNQSRTDRFLNNAKIGLGYVPEAAVNVGMAAAFMPEGSGALGLVNEALNPLAGIKTSIPDELRQGLRTQGINLKNKPQLPKEYDLVLDKTGNRYWLKHNNKDVGQIEYMTTTPDVQGRNWGSINIEIDKAHRGKGLSAPMYQKVLDLSEQKGDYGIMSMDKSLQSPTQSKAIRKYFSGKYSEDSNLLKNVNESVDEDNKLITAENIRWGDNEPLGEYESKVYLMSNKNKFQQGGIAQQKDQEWLKNWYANRVIPNKDIQGAYLEDKPIYMERLKSIPPVTKVDMIDNNPQKTGQYQSDTGKLLMTPKAQPSVYTHEVNHYLNQFPSTMRTIHENVVEQNMYKKGDPRLGVNNDNYDYLRDLDEIHSRVQVLRKDAGFKPDEEVTQEKLLKYLQNYKGDDENILQLMNLTDEKGLLEMLNYMADAPKNKEKQYVAQQGGQQNFTENELAFLSEIAIKDNQGQYNHPLKITQIQGGDITMQGINYPLLGVSKETGETKYMLPNKEYKFGKKTKNVIEVPFFKK